MTCDNIYFKEKIKSVLPFSIPEKAYFVGIIFKAYREMRNNAGDLTLGTKVINAIVKPPPSDLLDEPVTMIFEKNIVSLTLAIAISELPPEDITTWWPSVVSILQ